MFEVIYNILGVLLIFFFLCLAVYEYHKVTTEDENGEDY